MPVSLMSLLLLALADIAVTTIGFRRVIRALPALRKASVTRPWRSTVKAPCITFATLLDAHYRSRIFYVRQLECRHYAVALAVLCWWYGVHCALEVGVSSAPLVVHAWVTADGHVPEADRLLAEHSQRLLQIHL